MSNNIQYLNTDVLQLFSKLAKKDDKSCIFDASSVLQVLKLAHYGIGNKYKNLLNSLKNMVEIAPKLPSKSAVLIRDGYNFNRSYVDKFKNDVFLDYIPTTSKQVQKINENIREKYPKNDDDDENFLNDTMTSDAFLAIINESSFKGDWELPFEGTENDNFYISEDKILTRPMMYMDLPGTMINSFQWNEEQSLVVTFDYKNGYKMLIIRPNKPKNKRQLIRLCDIKLNGALIQKFMNNMQKTEYTNITMPKFSFKSEWDLKDAAAEEIPYLLTLFNGSLVDYSNISPDMIRGQTKLTTMKSSSQITNFELGTKVDSRTEMLCFDSAPKKRRRLDLNSPFIFMIINNECKIVNIGLFVG